MLLDGCTDLQGMDEKRVKREAKLKCQDASVSAFFLSNTQQLKPQRASAMKAARTSLSTS